MNYYYICTLFLFFCLSCSNQDDNLYWQRAGMAEKWHEKSPHFAKEILEEMKKIRPRGLEPEHEELLREVNRKIDELQKQN